MDFLRRFASMIQYTVSEQDHPFDKTAIETYSPL